MTEIEDVGIARGFVPNSGVITLFGYNVQVRVDRGHLLIDDGIGTDRRRFRLPRVGHKLKRLIIVGSDGMLSLAAVRWLADQDAAFVMLERDGTVLATTGPVRASDARLRRAQALANQSDTALVIARELIDKKLAGQERVARDKLLAPENADTIRRFRSELAEADTPEVIRLIESQAASAYWAAWRSLAIRFPRKDESRVPAHWRVFGARISPLTGSPRTAVNPPNAILNYLYCLLESESRLFDTVKITTEGLTLQGHLPRPIVSLGEVRGVELTGSITTTEDLQTAQDIYYYPGSKACPPASFLYMEARRDQVGAFGAEAKLLGAQRIFGWTIGLDPPVSLVASSGRVVIQAHVHLPNPDGVDRPLGQQSVSLDYTIANTPTHGSTLTISDTSGYCYALLVRVDCTDQTGESAAAWQEFAIRGDVIEFREDYANFMKNCRIATLILIDNMRSIPEGVPKGGDRSKLTKKQIVAVIEQAIREGLPGTDAALNEATAEFGSDVRTTVLRNLAGSVVGIRPLRELDADALGPRT